MWIQRSLHFSTWKRCSTMACANCTRPQVQLPLLCSRSTARRYVCNTALHVHFAMIGSVPRFNIDGYTRAPTRTECRRKMAFLSLSAEQFKHSGFPRFIFIQTNTKRLQQVHVVQIRPIFQARNSSGGLWIKQDISCLPWYARKDLKGKFQALDSDINMPL